MTRLLKSILWLLFPLVQGSSLFTLQEEKTYCTGNLTDLDFMSISCSDSTDVCTWGSVVSVFAQVNATGDFPKQTHFMLTPSVARLSRASWGSIEATDYTSNYCSSILHAPAGADAGYTCPEAGLYNVRLTFPLFGESLAWYGDTYGYNIGLSMKVSDAATGDDYAFCYTEIKVSKGTYRHTNHGVSTTWGALVGGAGLAGLSAALLGFAYRKRRVATTEGTSEEMVTNFELVNDPILNV